MGSRWSTTVLRASATVLASIGLSAGAAAPETTPALTSTGAATPSAIAVTPSSASATATALASSSASTSEVATAPPPSLASLPTLRAYVVAAIGDSLTDPRAGGGRYMRELARQCPESGFDTYGVGGQTTFDMRARFAADLFGADKPRYTHVLVLGGVNDLVMGFVDAARVARIEEQLAAMYRAARDHGVTVIAATVPPHPLAGAYDKSDALNAWISARAPAGDVAFVVDLASRLACGAPDVLCASYRATPGDRIHWSAEGHRAVANELRRVAFSDCR